LLKTANFEEKKNLKNEVVMLEDDFTFQLT